MAVLEGKKPCKDHEPACCSKCCICAGIYLASKSTKHKIYRGWGNASTPCRVFELFESSQGRGLFRGTRMICLVSSYKWIAGGFLGLLPWKPGCFPTHTSLLGWQQLQGPLQRILGADSPLRSVREKAVCGMRCLRSISQQKEHCREQASSTAEKKANVAAETSCNVHLANICSGRLIKYSITPGDCTKICSDAAGAEALGRSPSLWPP